MICFRILCYIKCIIICTMTQHYYPMLLLYLKWKHKTIGYCQRGLCPFTKYMLYNKHSGIKVALCHFVLQWKFYFRFFKTCVNLSICFKDKWSSSLRVAKKNSGASQCNCFISINNEPSTSVNLQKNKQYVNVGSIRVCMYVCMYAGAHLCVCVYLYAHTYIHIPLVHNRYLEINYLKILLTHLFI